MESTDEPGAVSTSLHEAVKSKDINTVRKILNAGGHIYINVLNNESKSPLHIAIEEELSEIVELFLSINEEQIVNDQYLLIYRAISKGNIKMVKLLAERYFNKERTKQNMKAFWTAIKETKFEILNYLLGLLNDLDTNSSYYTASVLLYSAIFAGNIEIVKKILESDGIVNDTFESSSDGYFISNEHAGYSPLHLAVQCLKLDIVKLLLNAGANISKQNQEKSTALHIAFEAKMKGVWKTWQDFETNNKIIDFLLDVDLGKNAKLTNQNGISHLHALCSRDKSELIEKLLQEKYLSREDLETSDKEGFSCLHFAAKYNCLKVATILLQNCVNVNHKDHKYRTPLHIAVKGISSKLVQILMQHGADLILRDCDGYTPIHIAFRERDTKILDLLLTSPTITNFNPCDAEGVTHFHIACTRNNVNLVKAFIDSGVVVNLVVPSLRQSDLKSRNNEDLYWQGCTPLHFAAVFNRPKIVELLLSNGADVHRKNTKGYSPIHMACQQNYDRFGDLIKIIFQEWKNNIQLQTRPYADVTSVEEDPKKVNSYPQRFPTMSSQLDIDDNEEINRIINWTSNRQDQIDIILILLKNGADINVIDNLGNSPLYYIYDFNIHKILDILYQKLQLDKKFGTILVKKFLMELYGRRTHLLNEIFKFGVRINIDKSYNNKSILHYICQNNEFFDIEKAEMIKYFLERNADPNAIDNSKKCTPLHIAIEDSVEFSKIRGEIQENTPFDTLPNVSIQYSRERLEYEEMIRTLLEQNAQVNFRDITGRTPLFLACLKMKYNLVNVLLQHGADVNIVDNDGKTLFYYFYKKHFKHLTRQRTAGLRLRIPGDVFLIARALIYHVMTLQELGLYVNEQVENLTLQINRCLTVTGVYNELEFRNSLRKQVEILKTIEINDRYSLYYILFMDERALSRNMIIEQLNKFLTPNGSCFDNIPNYFNLVNLKLNIAVKRKRFLSEAKETLNRLLSSNFPEVCSELIFMELSSFELATFVRAFAGYL